MPVASAQSPLLQGPSLLLFECGHMDYELLLSRPITMFPILASVEGGLAI